MKRMFLIGCALSLYVLATPAFAAEDATSEKRTAEPVVVTAGRIQEKAKNVTNFVTVIPQEEIQKNQYQDMGGLLRNYGVQIDSYTQNTAQAQVKIRGVFTSFPTDPGAQGGVLILVDGRRIGTNNIGMIPMVNIERIEIMRGPGAVQYGTSAIGGVVNVITKRGTEELSASAQGGIGSWETYKGQGSLAWAYGPFDFSGGISYMSTGDYFTGGNSPHKFFNTEMNGKLGYSVNAGINFLEEHRIGVTALGTNADHVGSPGRFEDYNRREYIDISSYSADFLYEGGYRDWGLSWKGRYFFGRENHYNGFDDENPAPFGDRWMQLTNDYRGAQGQLTFKKSFLTLTGGVDWLNTDSSKESPRWVQDYDSKYRNENLGVFALAKIALFDDMLIVSGGVRHDTYRLRTSGDEKSSSKYLEKTVPSFGVAFHPLDWLTLKANYGESYRVPNALELLGYSGGGAWGSVRPNKDLQPEEAKSWDVGFEIEHKSLKIGLNYFATEYKKKIISDYILLPGWAGGYDQYNNASGRIWYKGFEGNASYDIGEVFDWPVKVRPYVNFTALTERKASTGSQWSSVAGLGSKVPNVSDLELAYGLNFAYPDVGFEADLRCTYTGYQHNYARYNATADAAEYERVGGKTLVDLFVRQKVFSSEKAGTFSVYGEIRNMFNERYALIRDYQQAGRSFFVGLRYEYN
jgi:vitamin B12 transporter